TEFIPESERDRGLWDALAAEASGILNWAIAGFQSWQETGLNPPAAVRAATDQYRAESDVLADFIAERNVVFEARRPVAKAVLYRRYESWAEGHRQKPMSNAEFGQVLTSRPGITQKKSTTQGDRAWYWHGVGVVDYR